MVTPGSISYSPLGQKKPFLTIPDYFEIQSTFARNPNLNLAFSVTKRTKKRFYFVRVDYSTNKKATSDYILQNPSQT